jgi:hypothetical protein
VCDGQGCTSISKTIVHDQPVLILIVMSIPIVLMIATLVAIARTPAPRAALKVSTTLLSVFVLVTGFQWDFSTYPQSSSCSSR